MKPYPKESTCEGKKKYTKRHAHNDSKDLTGNGEILQAYKCRYCNYYHVGHLIEKKKEAKAMNPKSFNPEEWLIWHDNQNVEDAVDMRNATDFLHAHIAELIEIGHEQAASNDEGSVDSDDALRIFMERNPKLLTFSFRCFTDLLLQMLDHAFIVEFTKEK